MNWNKQTLKANDDAYKSIMESTGRQAVAHELMSLAQAEQFTWSTLKTFCLDMLKREAKSLNSAIEYARDQPGNFETTLDHMTDKHRQLLAAIHRIEEVS